jgi:hypothetical protein
MLHSMNASANPTYEKEVIFPDQSTAAARVFLAVMAYPEIGAGQPDGAGFAFAQAQAELLLWSKRKAFGLRPLADELAVRDIAMPKRRDFAGRCSRGVNRLEVRVAALRLYRQQSLLTYLAMRKEAKNLTQTSGGNGPFWIDSETGFLNARTAAIPDIVPSTASIVRRNAQFWFKQLGQNLVGKPADVTQKAKDVIRRNFSVSKPVLHMAHALEHVCKDIAPSFAGWNSEDNLLVLLINAEKWIWDAIDTAEDYRKSTGDSLHATISPDQLITLKSAEKCTLTLDRRSIKVATRRLGNAD